MLVRGNDLLFWIDSSHVGCYLFDGVLGRPAAFVLDALALVAFSRLDFCDFIVNL